jgi:flagellar FliL protein
MAVEAEVDDAAPAKAARSGRRGLVLIAAGALGVVALGAAGYFFLVPRSEPVVASAPQSFIFNLPPLTVNLNSDGGEAQFMKLTVALEVANEQMMLDIQPKLAKVIDAFQVYLRELRRSDLEGSAGIYRLREELRRRVNVAIFPASVESVLFREILVQ